MFLGAIAIGWRLVHLFGGGHRRGHRETGVAGGGTFITFPTLLATGIPALQANLSTSVGVVPSYLGSFARVSSSASPLSPSHPLADSFVRPGDRGPGCTLLLSASPSTFRSIVPWLIGAGTVLFAASPLITKRLTHVSHEHPARRWALFIGVFVVSAYGGYFGAGLGILVARRNGTRAALRDS